MRAFDAFFALLFIFHAAICTVAGAYYWQAARYGFVVAYAFSTGMASAFALQCLVDLHKGRRV